jgi:hypothetical protein
MISQSTLGFPRAPPPPPPSLLALSQAFSPATYYRCVAASSSTSFLSFYTVLPHRRHLSRRPSRQQLHHPHFTTHVPLLSPQRQPLPNTVFSCRRCLPYPPNIQTLPTRVAPPLPCSLPIKLPLPSTLSPF